VSVYELELKRIESKLQEFLQRPVAREIVARIYGLARDADEEIERILQDPEISRLYEYDGQLFMARGSFEFHQAFSGLNALRSLTDSIIDILFRSTQAPRAVRRLVAELHHHAMQARRNRIQWEETGTLGASTDDGAASERIGISAGAETEMLTDMSPEEEKFFGAYEREMSEFASSRPRKTTGADPVKSPAELPDQLNDQIRETW